MNCVAAIGMNQRPGQSPLPNYAMLPGVDSSLGAARIFENLD